MIGGGIYGACVARDAALRGLSVALIDKGDFGHATSFNSQKTIHGGFRYLQNADLRRVREAIRERRAWLTVAPHLIRPLPFLIPLFRDAGRSRATLAAALHAYDVLAIDRNRGCDPAVAIPRGRLMSRDACIQLSGLSDSGLIGGAVFHDGLIESSARLVLAFVQSAAAHGAIVANYVEATGFLERSASVVGVSARDNLSLETFDIQARMTVNTTGPWINRTLQLLNTRSEQHPTIQPMMKDMYLIVRRPVLQCALGLLGKDGHYLFAVPWRGFTMIGVGEYAFDESELDSPFVREREITVLLERINNARPFVGVHRGDVMAIRAGALPVDFRSAATRKPRLATSARIIDHRAANSLEGLLSVSGIKFTMARRVAEAVVDQVFHHRGQRPPGCVTATVPVAGADLSHSDRSLEQAVTGNGRRLDSEATRALIQTYGSDWRKVVRDIDSDATLAARVTAELPVLRAQVRHAVRDEMARKLGDVLYRRTSLGTFGNPVRSAIDDCAAMMADELHWDAPRLRQELLEVGAMTDDCSVGQARPR